MQQKRQQSFLKKLSVTRASEFVEHHPYCKLKGGDVFVYVAESERHISKCKVIVLYI